jgi:hypothetical protein
MKPYKLISLALTLCCAVTFPLHAGGTIFVQKEAPYAWHGGKLSFIPKQKADGGITIAQIDAWVDQNSGMRTTTKTCFMDFVRNDEILGIDRATQDDIDETLKTYPNSFDLVYQPEKETQFRVRIGVFEACEDPKNKNKPYSYMALVVTDPSNAIKKFDPLDWDFLRLAKDQDGKINIFGCFNCGDVRELIWDKFNGKFYYEWVGH